MMFSRVVIATDLSEASDQIVVNLDGLIPLGTKEIILAHAMDIPPQSISAPGFDYNESVRGDLNHRAQARLAKLQRFVEGQGFQASSSIVYGTPSSAIEALARQVDASLVIVGSRGASLAKDIVLGTSALDILHHSHFPVLLKRLVKNGPANDSEYRLVCRDFSNHLLFGTDFSATANLAFEFLEQIVSYCGSRVTLLHVMEDGESSPAAEVTARLSEMKEALKRAGASETHFLISKGSPATELTRAAEASEISLVVLGARGNGSPTESVLGQTSREVARGARVPILMIPPAGITGTKRVRKPDGETPTHDLDLDARSA